jgi:hypothetical protein
MTTSSCGRRASDLAASGGRPGVADMRAAKADGTLLHGLPLGYDGRLHRHPPAAVRAARRRIRTPLTAQQKGPKMSSSAKRKTTMAKRDRENAVRERRLRKQARREARKLAAAQAREEAAVGTTAADGSVVEPTSAEAEA